MTRCNMGGVCGRVWQSVSNEIVKYRVKSELRALLYNIIATEVDNFNTVQTVDVHRLNNFKSQMALVRNASDQWHDLLHMRASATKPCHTVVKALLDRMDSCQRGLDTGLIICICTYVIDVCVTKLEKSESVNVCKGRSFLGRGQKAVIKAGEEGCKLTGQK